MMRSSSAQALVIVVGLGEQRLDRARARSADPRGCRATRRRCARGCFSRSFFDWPSSRPSHSEISSAHRSWRSSKRSRLCADLRVVGDERQQLLVVADRLLGLVRDVLRELRGFAEQADACACLSFVVVDRAVVEREHIVPALGDRVDHRQALQRRVRARRELRARATGSSRAPSDRRRTTRRRTSRRARRSSRRLAVRACLRASRCRARRCRRACRARPRATSTSSHALTACGECLTAAAASVN